MEEIVALFAVCILTGVGWVAAKLCFAKVIRDENCIYFAPALGAGICGCIAYVAIHSYQPWLIRVFCLAVSVVAVLFRKRLHSPVMSEDRPWRLFRFTALTVLALYGMQILLYGLFSRLYPGPHGVWTLFNMTGAPPPDQMFAWHQGMFADQHRHYPRDPFLADIDLYDQTHLGGYITLFFFKLFQLPLTEDHFVYPADGLHFYHCLWWLLNNLYLVGVAPLFRRLFGYRGAIIAVATSALGGFFFICNAGVWIKFAGSYPFLLAFLLYLENRGPILQAALCAVSYYIHGSVLPFLAGFGLLQLLNIRWPINGGRLPFRRAALFAATGLILVGTWFIVVRWMGSKQPLVYYYLYGAGLAEAQTKPVTELARAFYDKHTWTNLSLFPVHSLLASWLPLALQQVTSGVPTAFSGFADALFALQRFCIECALGVVAAPVVIAGVSRALAREHAGKVAFCLYLVPTLMVALACRIDWPFSLHFLVLYHALCLFLWVTILGTARTRFVVIGMAIVAIEGLACVWFADVRLLPANGLNLSQVPASQLCWLLGYVALMLAILIGASWEVGKLHAKVDEASPAPALTLINVRLAGTKILIGLAITAGVIALYSIYCLRFYPR